MKLTRTMHLELSPDGDIQLCYFRRYNSTLLIGKGKKRKKAKSVKVKVTIETVSKHNREE